MDYVLPYMEVDETPALANNLLKQCDRAFMINFSPLVVNYLDICRLKAIYEELPRLERAIESVRCRRYTQCIIN